MNIKILFLGKGARYGTLLSKLKESKDIQIMNSSEDYMNNQFDLIIFDVTQLSSQLEKEFEKVKSLLVKNGLFLISVCPSCDECGEKKINSNEKNIKKFLLDDDSIYQKIIFKKLIRKMKKKKPINELIECLEHQIIS